MATWTGDEFTKIGRAQLLEIASLKRDGTLRKPVTIWVVPVSGELYVRSVNGRSGTWFRGAQMRHEGHIRAGGVDKDVTFVEEANPSINSQIDAAYHDKYGNFPSAVGHIVNPVARSATIKLVPR